MNCLRKLKKTLFYSNLTTVIILCGTVFFSTIQASEQIESSTVSSKAPIRLGMSAAFTGPSQLLGIDLYRGAKTYFNYVNQTGGINGRKIELIAYDDGYNPEPAITNTLRFIEDEKVDFLFGYVGTPTTTQILPLLKKFEDTKTYLFFPYSGAAPQRVEPYNEFVLNFRASYADETGKLVQQLANQGRKKIGVFYQNDSYGLSGLDGVQKELAADENETHALATYSRGESIETSFEAQAKHFQESNVDAIITVGSYSACAGFIRDVRDLGWDVPIATISFVGVENMVNLLVELDPNNSSKYTSRLINSQVVPFFDTQSSKSAMQYQKQLTLYSPKHIPLNGEFLPIELKKPSFTSYEGFLNAKLLVTILKNNTEPNSTDSLEKLVGLTSYDIGLPHAIRFDHNNVFTNNAVNSVYFTSVQETTIIPLTDWSEFKK
jgi:branched-chain amino acid transport system substrate-binding protein